MDTMTGFYTTAPLTDEQCVAYLRRQSEVRGGIHGRVSSKVADRLAALAAENERLRKALRSMLVMCETHGPWGPATNEARAALAQATGRGEGE